MLAMAEQSGDTATAATARARLATPDVASDDTLMRAGLDALYTRRDAPDAITSFRQLLERNPNHYGANFQLAMALDLGGKPAEARAAWQKALKLAEQAQDKPTIDAARAHLQKKP